MRESGESLPDELHPEAVVDVLLTATARDLDKAGRMSVLPLLQLSRALSR